MYGLAIFPAKEKDFLPSSKYAADGVSQLFYSCWSFAIQANCFSVTILQKVFNLSETSEKECM